MYLEYSDAYVMIDVQRRKRQQEEERMVEERSKVETRGNRADVRYFNKSKAFRLTENVDLSGWSS